ncbi:MAG: hypothetical protein KME14_18580 [Tildeniella torsiva UHER 1998/13D]|jgi:hypothetical protein|nr:hypothetical protein [Tildeniella torsiva UHER 1998/13D]
MRELCDRRILAALRCRDGVTQLPVRSSMQIAARGVSILRNRSGYYVIVSAPGFERYTQTFDLAELGVAPAPATLTLQITDPSGQYLPRRFTVPLPRPAAVGDPAPAPGSPSVFQPIDIPLYPSPLARTSPGWAVLRTTVLNATTGRRLPWALIRTTLATAADTPFLGLSDWRGEALVAVRGIPITTWADPNDDDLDPDPATPPPVTTTAVTATLEVIADPTRQTIAPDADLLTMTDPNPNFFPDPEDLNARRATLPSGTQTLTLASGQTYTTALSVTLNS